MTVLELKQSIHEKIERINDESYLEMIYNMLLSFQEGVFIIPEHMKEGIRQGEEDIKNGRVHTMKELEERYKKYLDK